MNNFNDKMILRLKKQMAKVGINARELAERASVGRSFVYDILNGKSSNPTTKKLGAIAEILGVSVAYLIDGPEAANQNLIFPEGEKKSDDKLVLIPSLIVEAAKGGNVLVNNECEETPYYFRKSWVEDVLAIDAKDLRVVFVQGDSMEPTLVDGDMVLVDTGRNKPSPPGIFTLFDGDDLLVKRLENISGGKKTSVASDNLKYHSYNMDSKDINIVGRIVWFARRL
jgi:transcriptional regulator with XRE-family HTH domain